MTTYNSDAFAESLVIMFPFLTMGMIFLIMAVTMIFAIILSIVISIPYYKMAKNAGLPNPWLAFIPLGNLYIILNLSQREFNIFDWIRTYDRTKVFWYVIAGYAIFFGCYFIMMIPFLNIIFSIFYYALSIVFSIAVYIFSWRMNYDLLMTYGMEEHAMWASIANCFVPIVMVVFSFIIMNNEPDYTV